MHDSGFSATGDQGTENEKDRGYIAPDVSHFPVWCDTLVHLWYFSEQFTYYICQCSNYHSCCCNRRYEIEIQVILDIGYSILDARYWMLDD
jgi:hypothetical protein